MAVARGDEPTFRDFGATVIRQRIEKMMSYYRAVRRGNDPDAVHDMRVASRRLRAALAIFAPAFDVPEYEQLQKEVRSVTSALSRARDLDVMVDNLERISSGLPSQQKSLVAEVQRDWRSQRRKAQAEVVAALDRLQKFNPMMHFEAVLQACASVASATSEEKTTDEC